MAAIIATQISFSDVENDIEILFSEMPISGFTTSQSSQGHFPNMRSEIVQVVSSFTQRNDSM